tara:strand:- start:5500 stop:7938 length:2439 start_codon:yes stop_codon:yes gene_type:complete
MSQNSEFKNSVLLVDSGVVGILGRTKPDGAVLNYALRVNWGTQDRLRGVLGAYYVKTSTPNSPPDLINLGKGSSNLGSLGLASEVAHIPITVRQLPTHDRVTRYLIQLDKTAWNMLAFEEEGKDLLRQTIEEEGVAEGDPMWEHFLKTGIPGTMLLPGGATPTIPPVFAQAGNQSYTDLSSFYYYASADKEIRERSGLTVKVDPVYNFYVDTTPPYEEISLKVSEPMLTNFYCLESEIRNTGSTLNSADYFDQITLARRLQEVNIDGDAEPDPWFQEVAGPAGGFTESKTTQFYTLYSKGVAILEGEGTIGVIKGEFEENYKNIVILNSDLEAMNELVIRDDQTSGLRNMPFYNKITIGNDHDSVSDPSDAFGGLSFFNALIEDIDFEGRASFMDILQLYVVQNIIAGPSAVGTFESKTITKKSATNPLVFDTDLNQASTPLCFDLKNFMEDIVNDSTRIQKIIDRINTNTTTDDNFILIRNYNSPTGLVEASQESLDDFVLLNEDDRINYPIRDFDEILENLPCYSEPILYKVDKRVIKPDGNISPPVQTFFIGRPFGRDITYIDSQVKYGVRYQYDIKQIRMVFGNRYSYKDLKVFFSSVAGNGRAAANALGFYRPVSPSFVLDDYINANVEEYVSNDSDSGESQIVVSTTSTTGQNLSELNSYYIFKPSNFNDFVGGASQTAYEQIFAAGTNFVHTNEMIEGTTPDDREILESINITIKEGFGFNGNPTGGAVPAALNLNIPSSAMAPPDGAEIPEDLEQPLSTGGQFAPAGTTMSEQQTGSGTPGSPTYVPDPQMIAPDWLIDLLEGS